ncbi:MAG: DNA gyrase C-terminal beta-propeller domain-containing protein, partial [Gammaproteobacteria bacterium]
TVALIDNPKLSIDELMEYLPGPDFPTAGIINGARGIHEAYTTGRGRIYVRARTSVETWENGRERIVVTELPYQVNKARLLEKIAELVKEKKLEGITGLRDESDKDGMRMVIELRRGEVSEVVLNNLYQHTQMQNVFGINMVALVDGQPRTLNLRQMLELFLRHRREVVTRRTLFDLRKARDRAHILEGLAVALANIDEIIELIKQAPTPAEARAQLVARAWESGAVESMLQRAGAESTKPEDLPEGFGLLDDGYHLTEKQAQAILDLRLQKLTGLEQDKILKEFEEILDTIANLLDILSSAGRLMQEIRDELEQIREQFGDERRTEIIANQLDLTNEDLIPEEDMVVTISHQGYAKSQPLDAYQAQRRGGKGKSATKTKDEDFVDKLFVANTHDTILCFSSRGRVYWLKVYQLPQAGRNARGRPMNNLLPLQEGERINAVLPVRDYPEEKFVFMATSSGTVKKTPLQAFSRPLKSGIIALGLKEDDHLIGVDITDGRQDVMLFTSAGKAIRFNESQVRAMGRTAAGVRGIKLGAGQHVISLIIARDDARVLTATEKGYGKCTPIEDYPVKGRGGMGVISISTSERNGEQIGAVIVDEDDQIMLITDRGTLVRTSVSGISVSGRSAMGARIEMLEGDEEECDEIATVADETEQNEPSEE